MEDKQAIIELLKRYENCVNQSDAEGLGALYDDEAMLFPDRMTTCESAQNITSFYQHAFSMLTLNLSFDLNIANVFVEGDIGYATSTSMGTRFVKELNDTVPEINRELWVLKRVDEEWKIARYCFNKAE